MSDSNPNRPLGKMPSDAQMDNLLHDFFRLEMPVELNRPFRSSDGSAISSNPAVSTVTIVQVAKESTPDVQRNRQFVVVSALAALALTLVVLVQRQEGEPRTGAPIANTTEVKELTTSPPEGLMDVSTSVGEAVGDDGLTLPETDSEIKLRR
jgi:hypothetical protein